MNYQRFSYVLLPLLIALAVGCNRGPVVYPVSGTLTLDGRPLKEAPIGFIPAEGGRHGTAVTDENGNFTVSTFGMEDGALAGEHTVVVTAQKMVRPGNDRAGTLPVMEYISPARYDDPETSGLKVTVVKKMEPVLLDLKSQD